jgi:phytanoyl-CoA hydroxylase
VIDMKAELHPWNRSFIWQSPPCLSRGLGIVSERQARMYDELGYFVLEDVFDAATVRALTDEIAPFERQVTEFLRRQEDERFSIADARAITFSLHLVTRSRRLREFCGGPVFQALAYDLIGADVRLYWDQAVYKKSERPKPFPWHQDNGYTYVEPQQYLTCWVALSDATVDNGCPWVVPAAHRRGTLRHWSTDLGFQCMEDPLDALAVPVRAGGIAVFSSLTPHSTGPNLTTEVRKSYIVQFAPEGARVFRGDGSGAKPAGELQDDSERQFPILCRGQPAFTA